MTMDATRVKIPVKEDMIVLRMLTILPTAPPMNPAIAPNTLMKTACVCLNAGTIPGEQPSNMQTILLKASTISPTGPKIANATPKLPMASQALFALFTTLPKKSPNCPNTSIIALTMSKLPVALGGNSSFQAFLAQSMTGANASHMSFQALDRSFRNPCTLGLLMNALQSLCRPAVMALIIEPTSLHHPKLFPTS